MNEEEIQALIFEYYGCNSQAGNELCRRLFPEVRWRVAYGGVPPPDIDDVTQEVVFSVANTKGQGTEFSSDQGSCFGAWLREIMRNIITDFYRRRQRIHRHETHFREEDEDPAANGSSPEEPVDKQDEQEAQFRALRAWLAHLSPRQREVMDVILNRLADRKTKPTNQEIAAELGISPETVAVHLCNAIQTLQGLKPREVEIDTCRNR